MFSKPYHILNIMKKFLIPFMKDEKETFLCRLWVVLYYIAGHCLFTDLHESDSGNYTCKASSETGETSQSATLLVFISKTKQRNLPLICHF